MISLERERDWLDHKVSYTDSINLWSVYVVVLTERVLCV
jgi:hypothetical protein